MPEDLVSALLAAVEQARARRVEREQQVAASTAAALAGAPKACHHQSSPGRGACLECYAAWIRDQRAAMHPDKAAELAETDRIDARIEAELEAWTGSDQ